MNNEKNLRIRIKIGEREIEIEGGKEFINEKLSYFEGKLFDITEETKKISIIEFLKIKKPKSHIKTVLVFAYFLDVYRKMKIFNSEDISKMYDEARIKKPTNINDTINGNVKQGNIMELKEQKEGLKAFSITRSGIEYVDLMGAKNE